MILIWLGSLVLTIVGLRGFQRSLAKIFLSFQMNLLNKNFSNETAKLFFHAVGLLVVDVSPQRSLHSAVTGFNLRILPLRPAVLLMCLSPLAVVPLLFFASSFSLLSGYFVLGAVGLFMAYQRNETFNVFKQILFFWALFLMGSEGIIKNSSVLQTILNQWDLVFSIADGRFQAIALLMLFTFVLHLFIQFEFWSLVFSLALLATGFVSFNGALALVLGERLGAGFLLWWNSRRLDKGTHRLVSQYSILMAFGSVLGFWFAAELRVLCGVGYTSQFSAIDERVYLFLILVSLLWMLPFLLGMLWGHFASKKSEDELQEGKYISSWWLQDFNSSSGFRRWAQQQVNKRLSEIRYHIAGLQTLKENQVPPPVQNRLLQEERQLSKLKF